MTTRVCCWILRKKNFLLLPPNLSSKDRLQPAIWGVSIRLQSNRRKPTRQSRKVQNRGRRAKGPASPARPPSRPMASISPSPKPSCSRNLILIYSPTTTKACLCHLQRYTVLFCNKHHLYCFQIDALKQNVPNIFETCNVRIWDLIMLDHTVLFIMRDYQISFIYWFLTSLTYGLMFSELITLSLWCCLWDIFNNLLKHQTPFNIMLNHY